MAGKKPSKLSVITNTGSFSFQDFISPSPKSWGKYSPSKQLRLQKLREENIDIRRTIDFREPFPLDPVKTLKKKTKSTFNLLQTASQREEEKLLSKKKEEHGKQKESDKEVLDELAEEKLALQKARDAFIQNAIVIAKTQRRKGILRKIRSDPALNDFVENLTPKQKKEFRDLFLDIIRLQAGKLFDYFQKNKNELTSESIFHTDINIVRIQSMSTLKLHQNINVDDIELDVLRKMHQWNCERKSLNKSEKSEVREYITAYFNKTPFEKVLGKKQVPRTSSNGNFGRRFAPGVGRKWMNKTKRKLSKKDEQKIPSVLLANTNYDKDQKEVIEEFTIAAIEKDSKTEEKTVTRKKLFGKSDVLNASIANQSTKVLRHERKQKNAKLGPDNEVDGEEQELLTEKLIRRTKDEKRERRRQRQLKKDTEDDEEIITLVEYKTGEDIREEEKQPKRKTTENDIFETTITPLSIHAAGQDHYIDSFKDFRLKYPELQKNKTVPSETLRIRALGKGGRKIEFLDMREKRLIGAPTKDASKMKRTERRKSFKSKLQMRSGDGNRSRAGSPSPSTGMEGRVSSFGKEEPGIHESLVPKLSEKATSEIALYQKELQEESEKKEKDALLAKLYSNDSNQAIVDEPGNDLDSNSKASHGVVAEQHAQKEDISYMLGNFEVSRVYVETETELAVPSPGYVLALPLSREKHDLTTRLSRLWATLEIPCIQKLEMSIKYCNPRIADTLESIIVLWEDATIYVVAREMIIYKTMWLETQRKLGEFIHPSDMLSADEMECLKSLDCYEIDSHASPASCLQNMLEKIIAPCMEKLEKLEDETGESLIFRGANYLKLLRKQQEREEIEKKAMSEADDSKKKNRTTQIRPKKKTRKTVTYVGNPFIRRVSDIIFAS
eukprot:g2043.t1